MGNFCTKKKYKKRRRRNIKARFFYARTLHIGKFNIILTGDVERLKKCNCFQIKLYRVFHDLRTLLQQVIS